MLLNLVKFIGTVCAVAFLGLLSMTVLMACDEDDDGGGGSSSSTANCSDCPTASEGRYCCGVCNGNCEYCPTGTSCGGCGDSGCYSNSSYELIDTKDTLLPSFGELASRSTTDQGVGWCSDPDLGLRTQGRAN